MSWRDVQIKVNPFLIPSPKAISLIHPKYTLSRAFKIFIRRSDWSNQPSSFVPEQIYQALIRLPLSISMLNPLCLSIRLPHKWNDIYNTALQCVWMVLMLVSWHHKAFCQWAFSSLYWQARDLHTESQSRVQSSGLRPLLAPPPTPSPPPDHAFQTLIYIITRSFQTYTYTMLIHRYEFPV